MPEIEFVDPDGGAGPDEELVAGPQRQYSPRTKRLVRTVAAVILAIVAGSTLINVLRGSDDKIAKGSATYGSTKATAPEGARPGTLAGRTPSPSTSAAAILVCPNVDACTGDLDAPYAVREALAHALPGATVVSVASTLVDGPNPTLYARQITARDGRLSVQIDVEPGPDASEPNPDSNTLGGGSTVSASADVDGFTITVTISGPDTAIPGYRTVIALAADRRLLTVS